MTSDYSYGFNQQKEAQEPLSVFAAINLTNNRFKDFPLTIQGEVSELNNKKGYAAVYFTIKDDKAVLPCMMWANKYKATGIEMTIGSKVVVTGVFNIYAPKGRATFNVTSLELAGVGNLQAQIAALAEKLRREGLMDPVRKRPAVQYPQVVGLVTSPRGAAVYDVIRTFKRRFPSTKIVVAGVPVEGKDAHLHIMQGIDVCITAGVEEIFLVRGGGSFEDFMPFNNEALARKIVSCPVPVITGIGHEPDNTIADMVADVRGSNPTNAVQEATKFTDELGATLDNIRARMTSHLSRRLDSSQRYLNNLASRPVFQDSHVMVTSQLQELDLAQLRLDHIRGQLALKPRNDVAELEQRLFTAGTALTKDQNSAVERAGRRLISQKDALVLPGKQQTEKLYDKMGYLLEHALDSYKNQSSLAISRLDDLSPLKTMARGWSIVRDDQGSVVKSVDQVKVADSLQIKVCDGSIQCAVTSTQK